MKSKVSAFDVEMDVVLMERWYSVQPIDVCTSDAKMNLKEVPPTNNQQPTSKPTSKKANQPTSEQTNNKTKKKKQKSLN